MDHPHLYTPECFKVAYERAGQYRRFQQPRKRSGSIKRKGIERWHKAESTNLVKQNVLVPKEESSSNSDMEFHKNQKNQKKNMVPYSSKKRPYFPVFKRKQHSMENILRKSDLTVGKLQMQVDDLIETVTDKSMKLLAQRHAELQQCEFLGDEILQSSKQLQRMSRRTMRKYKLKNVCFPCTWCCFRF
ncbi:hypothetical protein MJG53_016351 [Ovis ammon polii x Ovis aries]|uniref:Uncharacterized protein n=1 Tax=Ovis ammon polii x Ovis aries TaxID=2918886 RepID=A0ACB9UBL4_9CETA|nr:hypothetical protein MJG53_016351 [Ovis ammon polii x Ovis aries]